MNEESVKKQDVVDHKVLKRTKKQMSELIQNIKQKLKRIKDAK